MSQSFPLYDELETEAKGYDKTFKNNDNLLIKLNSMIGSLSDDQIEIIAAIIIHYAIKSGDLGVNDRTDERIERIYGAKKVGTGKGRLMTIKNLPDKLQRIIGVYLNRLR